MSVNRKARKDIGDRRLFMHDVAPTETGTLGVRLLPAPPLRSLKGYERDLAALIYEIAAELERGCNAIDEPWVVTARPADGIIELELGDVEGERALFLVHNVLFDFRSRVSPSRDYE